MSKTVSWLPTLPSGWREISLQYLAVIETGSRDTVDAKDDGEFPFIIRSAHPLRIDTYSYDTEAILTAGDGAVGEIFHHISGKFEAHQRVYVIHSFRGVYGRFLYWYISSQFRQVVSYGGAQTTVASLRRSMLATLPVALPPLESQRRIADYLDRETGEIDAMINKLGDLDETLKQLGAQTTAVFGLDNRGEFQEADVNSPLAGIPDHWDRSKFGYEFTESTELNGDNPPGPLLSISEYRGVELNTRVDGQQASLDVSKYRVVRPGQLAANMMWLNHGGLGVSDLTGYISPDYKTFWISERSEQRYVHYLFRSRRYIQHFETIATGVRPNAQRVTKTSLDLMPIPVPPLEEQRRIADHLDDVTSKIDAMLAKVAQLKDLLTERRAALITDVVTGRKDV